MVELETLRAQIDAIDEQLIALFKQRIEVVDRVGTLKREQGCEGLFIRPGREGKMHRRIYDAFKDTSYPPAAMPSIWRLLIAASTHHESALSVGLLSADASAQLPSLAQSYFGSFVAQKNYSTVGSLLADLREKRVAIGIAPYPSNDADWWLSFAQQRDEHSHIFAQLPVEHTRGASALAIGHVTPEDSGDDVSYIALTPSQELSSSRLQNILKESQLKADIINASIRDKKRCLLIKLDGFIASDHDALIEAQKQLTGSELIWLGAHPKPVVMGNV